MSYKLLLADDSVTIQRVIELTFADQDVQVLTAGDGEQAIVRVQADRPDIVLADIGMPKRSGYDVAAFVKAQPELSHVPVLLLAGAFEPVDEGRAQAAGCDGVLVKPFEPQHVIARVRELLQATDRSSRLAAGHATRAVADVPRPAERLAPPRSVEPPPREPPPVVLARQEPDRLMPFGAETGASGESLDEYFDRLDAAFANLATPGTDQLSVRPAGPSGSVVRPALPPPAVADAMPENDFDWFQTEKAGPPEASAPPTVAPNPVDIPTTFANPPGASIEWLPAGMVRPQGPPPEPAELSATISPGGGRQKEHSIADAFSALLAVEQGEPGAAPVRLGGAGPSVDLSEQTIEAIIRRVLERLAPPTVRDVVAEVVSDVAERLVREEIDRIRRRGEPAVQHPESPRI